MNLFTLGINSKENYMHRSKIILICMIIVLSTLFINQIKSQEADVKQLLEKTNNRGGICLILGSKDLTFTESLTKLSSLYVQIIQPDAKIATQWGNTVATSSYRENVGIRNTLFDPDNYSSEILNLIIVEENDSLGKFKLSDFYRILVPNGCVAFKNAPAGYDVEAANLKMTKLATGKYQVIFQKPVLPPPEWKICDSVKWKAGAGGIGEEAEIYIKDGTLMYADRLEVEGDLKKLEGRYIVRDAYNGRILKSEPLGDRKPNFYEKAVAVQLKPIKPAPKVPWAERGTGKGFKSFNPPVDGKLDLAFFGGHCFAPVQLGKYIVYHYNIWLDTETGERTYPMFLHPACGYGHVPGDGILYNFSSSKPIQIAGATGLVPADITFDHEPGGKVHQKFSDAPKAEPISSNDWPTFRADNTRSNSCLANLGDKPIKAWETKIGTGSASYGVMSGERTGLTQPVSAFGMVIVSDIDAERIVALDIKNGQQKWVFHVGSRVDFSPTLYNGLCLFTAKDGWVYCLNAQNGTLVWKLLISNRERLIGWQEKLANLWVGRSDVMIENGIGYASAGLGFSTLGGARAVAFKVETGEVIWRQCYHTAYENDGQGDTGADIFYFYKNTKSSTLKMGGYRIDMATGAINLADPRSGVISGPADMYMDIGNSLPRTGADLVGRRMSNNIVLGRTVAFSNDISVAYTVEWGVTWESINEKSKLPVKLNLMAANNPKTPLWKSPDMDYMVDDIVITPSRIYCSGHYQRVKKESELWVVSREDGQVISNIPIAGYPVFLGMSAAGSNLFVSTREGKLICYKKDETK